MQRRGVEPNVITWNAAISACAKGAQWERALEFFEEMQRRDQMKMEIRVSAGVLKMSNASHSRTLCKGKGTGSAAQLFICFENSKDDLSEDDGLGEIGAFPDDFDG